MTSSNFLIDKNCCLPLGYYAKILTTAILSQDQIKAYYNAFLRPQLWSVVIPHKWEQLERQKVSILIEKYSLGLDF